MGTTDAMDTSEDGGNRQLEAQYLTLLGTKLAGCVMELLVIALMKLRDLKQQSTGRRRSEMAVIEFSQQLAMSLDHSRLESKVRKRKTACFCRNECILL